MGEAAPLKGNRMTDEKDGAQGAGGATEAFDSLAKRLEGHDRVVIEGEDGEEYTLRYPRSVVKRMEASGVTAKSVAAIIDDGTLSSVEKFITTFILPGLRVEHPKMTAAEAVDLYRALPDKAGFIELAIGLFMQPVLALTTDPTETKANFRLV